MKIHKNQTGSAVIILLIVLILAIVGFGGYYVWHRQDANKTAPITAKTVTQTKYLTIKEWGVKMQITTPIQNATYQIIDNNKFIGAPAAFLSTTTLDASSDCVQYYQKGALADDPLPTFQHIIRHGLTDQVAITEAPPTVAAQDAVKQAPDRYKQVGNYVYEFAHGNGFPCSEQTSAQLPAFQAAFKSLQSE